MNKVYHALNNYFQIAYGEGINEWFIFNLQAFCLKYQLPVTKTYGTIQFLDRAGILTFSNENNDKAQLQFLIESREVVRYISLHPNEEIIIQTILRTYPGIFEQITAINTFAIANKTGKSEEQVIQILEKLKKLELIDLYLFSNDSKIIFNEPREDDYTINRIAKQLLIQNKVKIEKFQSMLNFVHNKETCKSVLISTYFGEANASSCGICSSCRKKETSKISSTPNTIIELLKEEAKSSHELQNLLEINTEDLIFALQTLLENDQIFLNQHKKYQLK